MIGKKYGSVYGLTSDELTIKNGRLINNKEVCVSGIQKLVDLNKSMKRAKKIEMYSEAIALGNLKSEIREEGFGMIMPFKLKK